MSEEQTTDQATEATEATGQTAEGTGQTTEATGQTTEGTGRTTEGTGQTTEQAKPQKPEGVPDAYWDAEKGEVKLDDLVKAAGRYDEHFGKRPEAYAVDKINERLPEGVQVKADDFGKLPVMQKLGEVLHRNGASQDEHDEVVASLLETMGGLTRFDPKAEAESLGDRGTERMKQAQAYATALGGHLESDEARNVLAELANVKGGVEVLEAVQKAVKGTPLAEGPKNDGERAEAEIAKLAEQQRTLERQGKETAAQQVFEKRMELRRKLDGKG